MEKIEAEKLAWMGKSSKKIDEKSTKFDHEGRAVEGEVKRTRNK